MYIADKERLMAIVHEKVHPLAVLDGTQFTVTRNLSHNDGPYTFVAGYLGMDGHEPVVVDAMQDRDIPHYLPDGVVYPENSDREYM